MDRVRPKRLQRPGQLAPLVTKGQRAALLDKGLDARLADARARPHALGELSDLPRGVALERRLGVIQEGVDDSVVEVTQARTAGAIARAKNVAWTLVHISTAKRWDDLEDKGKKVIYQVGGATGAAENR